MLKRPKFPGSSQSGLYLVNNEERSGFAAVVAKGLYIGCFGYSDPQGCRYGFHNKGRRFGSNGHFGRFEISEGDLREIGRIIPERGAVLFIPGGQGKPGMPVISAQQAYHPRAFGVAFGQFDGQVYGFATAYPKKV